MAPTSTRLLVLGAVRGAGPVHGYEIRRELLSWGADEWANVAPGSIYNALKTLAREGLITVTGTDRQGSRPERTVYELTAAGDAEFERLLRDNLLHSRLPNHPLLAGMAFFPQFPRPELVASLLRRADLLHSQAGSYRGLLRTIVSGPGAGGPGTIPLHVAESIRLIALLLESESGWARDVADRVQKGELDGLWETAGPADRPPLDRE